MFSIEFSERTKGMIDVKILGGGSVVLAADSEVGFALRMYANYVTIDDDPTMFVATLDNKLRDRLTQQTGLEITRMAHGDIDFADYKGITRVTSERSVLDRIAYNIAYKQWDFCNELIIASGAPFMRCYDRLVEAELIPPRCFVKAVNTAYHDIDSFASVEEQGWYIDEDSGEFHVV